MERVVAIAHTSVYPAPISFASGASLTLGDTDEEYPGWIRTRTPDGNEGWAPASLIDVVGPGRGVARAAYTARELDTRVGDVLTVLRVLAGWAWVRDAGGKKGWVPMKTLAR
ncbi:MAG: ligand-binding protein SH3 [Phycisphaerales bacterium]|nr:ligand-binding protein SH3 [Phycisphaerae bacterium]NNF44869.1 ligand-binding protein SH3 [Phycisphaerales bacterium]NNM24933.1 ligand-binding protein SH3 [Phycisphaerales bacterium]